MGFSFCVCTMHIKAERECTKCIRIPKIMTEAMKWNHRTNKQTNKE